jgi:branched-chain amino acid transport system ATP-binding protein
MTVNINKDDKLTVDGVSKSFGGIQALEDVSFTVKEGSITGLIGPNGAGKSTLFNCITGFHRVDEGQVFFDNKNITDKYSHAIANHGLIRTFQTPQDVENMSVRETLMTGPRNQLGESLIKLFVTPDDVKKEEKENMKKAQRMLELFEIEHLSDSDITELSGGQLKLVELARAMMVDPDILLLDEPQAGVNPVLGEKIKDHILKLNNQGVTFFIIEHEMDFITSISDSIVVLDQGHVLKKDSPSVIQSDDEVLDAYLGGEV